ncbi:MAG: nicotinate phosphoribosyltransferase [Candidatus Pacebacteria bacterium]|nr:nicotinate phosphoribosyltransferase [Candidatus Paceibacterota bacterium]
MEQYAPGCNKVYSYLIARSDKQYDHTVFFGLEYYLKQYLSVKLTPEMAEEFIQYAGMILGSVNEKGEVVPRIISDDVQSKIRKLCELGYFPIEIKAVPEGTVMPVRNVLMTLTNTLPDFHWVVGFVESLILKIWDPITTAACALQYRQMVEKYFDQTVDEEMHFLKDFSVHDFGYRGCSSEEQAILTGAGFLLNFKGSDTVPALPFVINHYGADPKGPIMFSVPASEHSVMCSFGREDELSAFRNMLRLYPEGIVSIVSDTFNVYTVLTDFAQELKEEILSRDGKVVFRPDSGNPEYIICGDPEAPVGSNEYKGAVRLLDEMFGSTVNSKGYKVLNPKVGLIYGDGMYLARYERTLKRLEEMGYAATNLVIGVGGILRNHSRDTLGFAIKATYVEVDGIPREIEKDPITDRKKKSHKGLLKLRYSEEEGYVTEDQVTFEQESETLLKPVFKDGQILQTQKFEDIRSRVEEFLNN